MEASTKLLTNSENFNNQSKVCSGARKSIKGNSVKIGDGPAAVIGDEIRNLPLVLFSREGAGIRMIRKSEDLPEYVVLPSWTRV